MHISWPKIGKTVLLLVHAFCFFNSCYITVQFLQGRLRWEVPYFPELLMIQTISYLLSCILTWIFILRWGNLLNKKTDPSGDILDYSPSPTGSNPDRKQRVISRIAVTSSMLVLYCFSKITLPFVFKVNLREAPFWVLEALGIYVAIVAAHVATIIYLTGMIRKLSIEKGKYKSPD